MDAYFSSLAKSILQLSDKVDRVEKILLSLNHGSKHETDNFLTIQEAANLLHLSVSTIYGMTQQSKIPFFKRSKRLYFSRDVLEEWIKAGRKQTVSEIEAEVEFSLPLRKKRRN